jgi:hypothetical protein
VSINRGLRRGLPRRQPQGLLRKEALKEAKTGGAKHFLRQRKEVLNMGVREWFDFDIEPKLLAQVPIPLIKPKVASKAIPLETPASVKSVMV